MKKPQPRTALSQFRREVRAGLRQQNFPTDFLWSAAWRELVAGMLRTTGSIDEWDRRRDAEDFELEAAQIMQVNDEQQVAA